MNFYNPDFGIEFYKKKMPEYLSRTDIPEYYMEEEGFWIFLSAKPKCHEKVSSPERYTRGGYEGTFEDALLYAIKNNLFSRGGILTEDIGEKRAGLITKFDPDSSDTTLCELKKILKYTNLVVK